MKVTGAGRDRHDVHGHHRRSADPDRRPPQSLELRRAQGRAAARRRDLRLPRRAHGAQRDARGSAGATSRRSTSNSRPASATLRRRPPSRRTPSTTRWCGASCVTRRDRHFDATELLRTQFALDDSQYFATVEVLPEDRDREKHTVSDQHRRGAEPPQSLPVRRRATAPTRRCAARSSWEDRRVNQRGHRFRTEVKAVGARAVDRRALHRAHRRSGHREVHAAAHRRTRAARRHRRPVRQFHSEHHAPARVLVRRTLAGNA